MTTVEGRINKERNQGKQGKGLGGVRTHTMPYSKQNSSGRKVSGELAKEIGKSLELCL